MKEFYYLAIFYKNDLRGTIDELKVEKFWCRVIARVRKDERLKML